MKISLDLPSLGVRLAAFAAAAILFGGSAWFALMRFAAASVANPRLPADVATLEAAAAYFPHSARLQARLAARLVEGEAEPTQSHESLAARAFHHASSAVRLAPANYQYRLLMAAAAELRGDSAAAEAALREALKLAPNNLKVRWQMANLLLGLGKSEEALSQFRFVVAADPARAPGVLSLVWQAAPGDLEALKQVVDAGPEAQLTLARFLAEQTQYDAAAGIFAGIARDSRLRSPESGRILGALLEAGRWQQASRLWRDTLAAEAEDQSQWMWNGGFERPPHKGLTQFDWQIGESDYARIGLSTQARTGERALKIAYLGRETTRLNNEIRQMVAVRPGARYRLECYTRAQDLVTPDGPRIVITGPDARTPIASSAAVSAGSRDWQLLSLEFVAPADAHALIVGIRQTPQFSYVEPTKGAVWFDDFSLKMSDE